jgi:cytidyltransferase-like protein
MNSIENKYKVAMIIGGFKPPTKGHLYLIEKALQIPDIKEIFVYIGKAKRDNITAEQSKKIFDLYDLPSIVKVEIATHNSPLIHAYDYAYFNPDHYMYNISGVRNIKELDESEKRQSIFKEMNNVEPYFIKGNEQISGTRARQALIEKNKPKFFSYLPQLDIIKQNQVWSILNIK